MRNLIIPLLLTALALPAVSHGEEQLYDRYGKEQGRKEPDGRVYDRYGQDQGRIEADGRIYDRYGKNIGRIERKDDKPSQRGTFDVRPDVKP